MGRRKNRSRSKISQLPPEEMCIRDRYRRGELPPILPKEEEVNAKL